MNEPKKNRINVSYFVIVLMPLLTVTVVLLVIFTLFRARVEAAFGGHIGSMPPEMLELAISIIVLLIVVLFFTGLALSFWVYKSVTEPLAKLGVATRKIRDGEYDFEIVPEGPDEIQELCRDFEEMRSRLREAGEEKLANDAENKELISNISHDLKTPIAAVKGYVEGILDGVADTPEKQERYLRTIYNKTNEMDRLINELTLYSRIDTNRVPYNFAKVNVHGFFDAVADDLTMELTEAGVSFTYRNEVPEDTRIIADTEQVRRVVSNIISNSMKYMDKEEKKIAMRIVESGDFVQMSVRDNGRGIAAQDVANVFKRFYRADSSRHEKGSGIGLSIVRKIVEDHGGSVYARSVEGEETTIYVEFRRYEEISAQLIAQNDAAVKRGIRRKASAEKEKRNVTQILREGREKKNEAG